MTNSFSIVITRSTLTANNGIRVNKLDKENKKPVAKLAFFYCLEKSFNTNLQSTPKNAL